MKGDSKKWISGVIFMAMLLTAPHPGAAETESADETKKTKVHHLPAVTVEEKREQKRADLKQESLSNPYRVEESAQVGTQVFTQEDIQNLKPRDLNDLLDMADGINVTYQGRKQPYFISQRGGGSFTYIIDGAVLPPTTNKILYKIPLSAIEELKVVRGATSLTLGPSIPIGSSNSGGGINTGYIIIRTNRPQRTTATLNASVEKSIGGHSVASKESLYAGTVIGEGSQVNGYVGGLVARMDRPSQDSWFDGQNSENGMVTCGINAGKLRFNLMGYTDRGRFEMQRGVKQDGSLDTAKWYYDPLSVNVFSGDGVMSWTPGQVSLFNVFTTEADQTEYNNSFTSATVKRSTSDEDTSGFGLRHNARFGDTLVQVGGQLSKSTGSSGYETAVKGLSGSVEQGFFNRRLVLDGGYRYDMKHIDQVAANSSVNEDVDMAPSEVYAFGARCKLTNWLALDGRYYNGEQGTTGDFDMKAQSGVLHAESQERIEISLESNPARFFNPTLTWFMIRIDNKKNQSSTTYVGPDGGTYYYYTESDEKRDGLELSISGTICKGTTYKAAWTHMYAIDSISNGVTTDNVGRQNPENLYFISLGQRWGQYKANVSVRKVDEWNTTTATPGTQTTGGLGGYTRVDTNISRDFVLKDVLLNVALFGRNLGDERYSTRYVTGFYPDRGLTYGMEMTLTY